MKKLNPDAPALRGLQHINIPVQNMERALRFYRDFLGLPLKFHEQGMAALGDSDADIFLVEGPAPLSRHFHFGWRLASPEAVRAWKEKLLGAGLALAHERAEENGEYGIYFDDGEGNRVEIYCEGNEA